MCNCLYLTFDPSPWRPVSPPQVDEERVQQMERENGFITRWNDKKDATVGWGGNPISPRPCMLIC